MEHSIFQKIDEGTVTVDDFNALISEAMPESSRDRMRRRTLNNVSDSHQDADGHQQLDLPTFGDRIQPKRERANNTQMHGRGKTGHRHSVRTQRRKSKASGLLETVPDRFRASMEFIVDNIGKEVTEDVLAELNDRAAAKAIITKLMSVPDINREWLSNLSDKLDESTARRSTGPV